MSANDDKLAYYNHPFSETIVFLPEEKNSRFKIYTAQTLILLKLGILQSSFTEHFPVGSLPNFIQCTVFVFFFKCGNLHSYHVLAGFHFATEPPRLL